MPAGSLAMALCAAPHAAGACEAGAGLGCGLTGDGPSRCIGVQGVCAGGGGGGNGGLRGGGKIWCVVWC